MFREQDHPRGSDGKFTDKETSADEKLRKAVSIYSDDPESDAPPQKRHEPAKEFERIRRQDALDEQ